ncbi:MAG: twin-arginine translocase TatA/TatE family subunit [Candidatus Bathyarchaeia archaeon]
MISAWEWVIIILAIIVLLLWGPSKIPELARGLGRAKAEFERASREYLYESSKPTVKETKESSTESDETIILIAKALGLNTEGKSREQILQEILVNIVAKKQEK